MHSTVVSFAADLLRQCRVAARVLLLMTVLLGLCYPVAVWAGGRLLGSPGDGRPIRVDGVVVGSALLGQEFTGPEWFHPRPSAGGYDSLATGPTNQGPLSNDLASAVATRRIQVARTEGVDPARVPPDALTASGSGLDPHISPAYALLQAPRVARATGLSLAAVEQLVEEHTVQPFLGVHGAPGVNVTTLNVAVHLASR